MNIVIESLKTKFENCILKRLTESEEDMIVNNLSTFDTFENYSLAVLSEAVEIIKNDNSSYLLLLNLQTTIKGVRIPQYESTISDYELIGLAVLKKKYGRVLIKPETLEDKINDLFSHVDIDFDFDKEFSKKYYVIATNESLFRNSISTQFIETIRDVKGLEIEINDNILIVRLRKQFTPENGEIIATFLTGINNGHN